MELIMCKLKFSDARDRDSSKTRNRSNATVVTMATRIIRDSVRREKIERIKKNTWNQRNSFTQRLY